MNKRFMLAMLALCFTGLSAQESEVGQEAGQEAGQEVTVGSDTVDASTVAEGNVDAEGSN
jgi:hypothetical protein